MWAWGPVTNPTPDRPFSWRVAGARYPLDVDAGSVGIGTRHQPHSARFCKLALPAVGRGDPTPTARVPASPRCVPWERHEGSWGGGGALAWGWGVRGWALPDTPTPVVGVCGRGLLPTDCGCG